MTSRWRKLVLGVLIICLLCMASWCCTIAFLAPMQITCWSVENFPNFVLEGQARFRFPATAHAAQVAVDNGSSWCAMAVKFEMKSGDLSQFETSTLVGKLAPTVPVNWGKFPHEPLVTQLGLNTDTVKSYLFGSTTSDYFNQQFVFVDTSDPKTYIVFLVTEIGYLD